MVNLSNAISRKGMMMNWNGVLNGLVFVALFLIVRAVGNWRGREKNIRNGSNNGRIARFTRRCRIPLDDKAAYCLLCHCAVEREPRTMKNTPKPPEKTAYQKAVENAGVDQWEDPPKRSNLRKE